MPALQGVDFDYFTAAGRGIGLCPSVDRRYHCMFSGTAEGDLESRFGLSPF